MNKLLLLHVENYQEDVLLTKFGQLDRFLDQASLSFAVGHVPLVFVCDFLDCFELFLSHLINYKLQTSKK